MTRRKTGGYVRECIVCGTEFNSKRRDAKLCSVKCRKENVKRQSYVKEKVESIMTDLKDLVYGIDDPVLGNEAWKGVVALSSYLAGVVSVRAWDVFIGSENAVQKGE